LIFMLTTKLNTILETNKLQMKKVRRSVF